MATTPRYMDKFGLEYYHNLIKKGLIEYIVGTQNEETNAWTGVSTSPSLFAGKVIIYHLPFAGNGAAATLNLTLTNGSTTGAKAVQNETAGAVTTEYAADSDIFMVYTGSAWKCSAVDTTYAPLNNPEFTGTPTAPTAAEGTKTKQIATTEFTTAAVEAEAETRQSADSGLAAEIAAEKARVDSLVLGTTTNASGWNVETLTQNVTVSGGSASYNFTIPADATVLEVAVRSAASTSQPWITDNVNVYTNGTEAYVQADGLTVAEVVLKITYGKQGAIDLPELTDIRLGADGKTYSTAGEAVRGQISDVKEDLSHNAVSKNLLGPSADVLYPCFIPANKKITLYTSDNETGLVFVISTYDKDGVRNHWWNVPNSSTATSRTLTVPDNAYYVSWRHLNLKMTGLPMCEIGDSPTGFTEWFPPVKVIQQEIEDLTEDIDIVPYVTVNGYMTTEGGNWTDSSSFQISKYPVKEGDVLVLDIAFPYASRGGVFQFQNAAHIPANNNTSIVGKRYIEGFKGLMVVPEGATWLMVAHQTGVNSNIVRLRQAKGIADLQEAVKDLDDVDRQNYSYKLRNFRQESDQYKKGNTSGTWYDRFVLLHISDNHVGNTSTSFPARNLSELTNISNDTKVDVVVNSGDMTIGGSSTLTRDDVNVMFDNFTDLSTDIELQSIPIIATLGNHDANDISTALIAHATTKADQWDHVFEAIKNKYPAIVWGDSTGKKHYHYYDVTKGSYTLRIIALDSLDHADYVTGDESYECQWCEVYSQEQIDWLCETALNVPSSNYGVIIVNHFPFAPRRNSGYSEEWPALNDGTFAQGWTMIPEIVEAWQNRTTIQKTFTDAKLGLNNISVDADFSQIPANAMFVCYMTGHTHSKNAYTVKEENGVSFNQLMLCEDSSGQQGNALNRAYKYDDGIQNTAASQVTIDMAERKIYRTAYGAYQHCSEMQQFPTAIFEF